MLSIKNTITAAQELADYFNWAVFPVNPKTKTPYFRGWQEIASSNPDEVEDIFSGLQYAAIGVCTGEASGLVCIDIDERADYRGLSNYQMVGFELPNCPSVQTPSGGLHLYFKQPPFKVKELCPTFGTRCRRKRRGWVHNKPTKSYIIRHLLLEMPERDSSKWPN